MDSIKKWIAAKKAEWMKGQIRNNRNIVGRSKNIRSRTTAIERMSMMQSLQNFKHSRPNNWISWIILWFEIINTCFGPICGKFRNWNWIGTGYLKKFETKIDEIADRWFLQNQLNSGSESMQKYGKSEQLMEVQKYDYEELRKQKTVGSMKS